MSNAVGQVTRQPPGAVGSRRWLALTVLALAQLMLILDVTIVNVALPGIAADLGLARAAMTWVVAAYALAFGGLMLLGGRLADAIGPRRTLLAGLAVFTLASLAAGLTTSSELLVVSRGVQGIGAALMSPAALAIITRTFHGQDRNRALGVWAAVGGSGAALGVVLGGLLTSGPGWRWVFFVNVPVGVIVAVAVLSVVAAAGRAAPARRIDLPGALTVTAATGLLVYGLVEAGDGDWTTAPTIVPLASAVLFYIAFVMVERRATAPLIRPEAFIRRPIVASTFVMLIATGLMIAFFFLTSLYLQGPLGFSAWETGLVFLPVAIFITVGAHLGSRLIGRWGGRPLAFAGFGLVALGAGLLTQLDGQANAYTSVLPGFVIVAIGIGPLFVTATSTALANVQHDEAGLASGVINTFHELGGAIGVAVISTVAASSVASHGADVSGFTDGYLLAAVTAGVAAVIAVVALPAGRPAAVFGHGH